MALKNAISIKLLLTLRWEGKNENTVKGKLGKGASLLSSWKALWVKFCCLTLDILGLCRAFFLKGKIEPRGHGPTFSSSERE